MTTVFLSCRKLAHNGSIAGVGGVDSATGVVKHFTEAQAIKELTDGILRLVVRDAAGDHSDVRVVHRGGHSFLETHRDHTPNDNLGKLAICHHSAAPSPVPTSLPYRPVQSNYGHPVHTSNFRNLLK